MIQVRELRKSFGRQTVLDGVNLCIDTGESLVIIGRSGGGKSILIKHLVGLIRPDSGEVCIDGEKITSLNERQLMPVRQKFGMLFQSAALFDSMTVAENVGFAMRRENLAAKELNCRVSEALDMVELPGTENKRPSELSGGMRKRVGLARAIVYRPQIVLYDEPTTGLDPVVADSIDKLIVRVRDRLNVTTVVVTHDMRSARYVGQRIAMLHEGKIYVEGTPDDIFRSTDPIVHNFVNGISCPEGITP